jgi:signal transduction histidine kinase
MVLRRRPAGRIPRSPGTGTGRGELRPGVGRAGCASRVTPAGLAGRVTLQADAAGRAASYGDLVLRSVWQRLRHPGPWAIDGAVAAALLAFMVGQLALQEKPVPGQQATTPIAYVLVVLIAAPLVTHRKWPLPSLAVCLAALLLYAPGRYYAYPGLVLFAMVFGITLHGTRRQALIALISCAAAMAVAVGLQPGPVGSYVTWVESELGIAVSWIVAETLRSRRVRWAELNARAERLEREREAEARRAATEERLRIARELHDVVAHSMSVIAVQSAVGGHVMDTQPEEARQALAAIESTSRSALIEMRRLLGVLRQDGEPAGSLVPAPGLADLAPLIAQVGEAGLRAWIQVEGERGPVPPGVDLSAYRIIQEALTNVIKHAAATTACVKVSYEKGSVALEISDDGPGRKDGKREAGAGGPRSGAVTSPFSAGHGIIGMRERVAVFGGEFAAGPRRSGGFRVFARLPFPEVTS